MSNRPNDILFQLIHSLEKAEKRHFKLYIRRSSSNGDLKIVQLFDALDKAKEYDEKLLLKKLPGVQKSQLSNLKAHLYKQILASLRLLKSADSIDLQLNEQFDYAHILYKKGLFLQSLRILEKAKALASLHQKMNFMPQVIALEKRIEALHITRSIEGRAESLSAEALQVSRHIDMVARLSNLSLKLYSWYIRHGHARNKEDEARVRNFLDENLPADAWSQKGFYEQLYLYQSLSWYAFIRKDFLMYYRYAQKWVDLFHAQPLMQRVETGHYIKGLHNLLNAHFDLRNPERLAETLLLLENFAITDRVQQNDSFRIQSFLYIAQARINLHFLNGEFSKGLIIVPQIEQKLEEYALFIDPHRVMVLNYKIAALYFGSGDYSTSIDYLQKIINAPADLRYDLQCYSRLLHLLAHYEMGNHELVEYLSKSVYRFMSRMEHMTEMEREMLRFLRRSFGMKRSEVRLELQNFLNTLLRYENDPYETRVIVYLDIISWVEHKVLNRPLGEVIRAKISRNRKKRVQAHAVAAVRDLKSA